MYEPGATVPGRRLDHEGVGAVRVRPTTSTCSSPSLADFILEVGDRAVVRSAHLNDDVDAALLDDHADVLAGGQRQLIAVLLAAGQLALDRRARLEDSGGRPAVGRRLLR